MRSRCPLPNKILDPPLAYGYTSKRAGKSTILLAPSLLAVSVSALYHTYQPSCSLLQKYCLSHQKIAHISQAKRFICRLVGMVYRVERFDTPPNNAQHGYKISRVRIEYPARNLSGGSEEWNIPLQIMGCTTAASLNYLFALLSCGRIVASNDYEQGKVITSCLPMGQLVLEKMSLWLVLCLGPEDWPGSLDQVIIGG